MHHTMKRHVTYAVALAALLLVGAGCAARKQPGVGAGVPPTGVRGAMEAKSEVKAEGTVEGTVDAILKDSEDEKAAQKEAEGDASDINADSAELNAYSDSDYDVK